MLSACSATQPLVQTEIIEVPVRVYVPIPEELLEPCRVPVVFGDNSLTYGDVVDYSLAVTGSLNTCNRQIEGIKQIMEEGTND